MNSSIALLIFALFAFVLVCVEPLVSRRTDKLGAYLQHPTVNLSARALTLLGIPLIALLVGALPRNLAALGSDIVSADLLFGFTRAQWLNGAGVTVAIAAFTVFILRASGAVAIHKDTSKTLDATLNAIFAQAHWQLLRAAVMIWLPDLRIAVVVGAIVVVVEWLARHTFKPTLRAFTSHLGDIAQYLVSMFLFLETQNIWLMIGAHLAIMVFSRWRYALRQTATKGT